MKPMMSLRERRAELAELDATPQRRQLTVHEVIDLVLDRFGRDLDTPALVARIVSELPGDFGSLRRVLQQLLACEVNRRLAGEAAPLAMPELVLTPAKDHEFPRTRGGRTTSRKWEAAAAGVSDPLQARVWTGDQWVRWAEMKVADVQALAKEVSRVADRVQQKVVLLDRLALAMTAANAARLADLDDALAKVQQIQDLDA